MVYVVFGTILKAIWEILFAYGLISIVLNSNKMKKYICHLVTLEAWGTACTVIRIMAQNAVLQPQQALHEKYEVKLTMLVMQYILVKNISKAEFYLSR